MASIDEAYLAVPCCRPLSRNSISRFFSLFKRKPYCCSSARPSFGAWWAGKLIAASIGVGITWASRASSSSPGRGNVDNGIRNILPHHEGSNVSLFLPVINGVAALKTCGKEVARGRGGGDAGHRGGKAYARNSMLALCRRRYHLPQYRRIRREGRYHRWYMKMKSATASCWRKAHNAFYRKPIRATHLLPKLDKPARKQLKAMPASYSHVH